MKIGPVITGVTMAAVFVGQLAAGGADTFSFTAVDDDFASEQWALFNFGQDIGGKPGGIVDADVRAPEAWSITMGDPSVVVAVVDTGVAMDHPDLADRIWSNEGETGTDSARQDKRTNGVDDDGDGYVDDWRGWDFVDGDNDPTDQRAKSVLDQSADIFHGTAVASVLAARANNQIGMAGVAPETTIMPLRVIGSGIQDADLAAAIVYAADHGAGVVNLSLASFVPGFGFPLTAQAMRDAPQVLFVAGAGNSANDSDITKPEPCAVPLDNLICVAATDENDRLASFGTGGSNWGATTVDLAAPGDNMLVAQPPATARYRMPSNGAVSDWVTNGEGISVEGVESSMAFSRLAGAAGDASVRLAEPVDLAGQTGCYLRISETHDISASALILETSTDGITFVLRPGVNGFAVSGVAAAVEQHDVPISADTGKLWIGFRFSAAGEFMLEDLTVTCNGGSYSGRDYAYAEGTSLAVPMTAGTAALVLARHPTFTPTQVKQAILDGVHPVAELAGKTLTGGRLDLYGSLMAAAGVGPAAMSSPVATGGDTGAGTGNGQLILDRVLPPNPRPMPGSRSFVVATGGPRSWPFAAAAAAIAIVGGLLIARGRRSRRVTIRSDATARPLGGDVPIGAFRVRVPAEPGRQRIESDGPGRGLGVRVVVRAPGTNTLVRREGAER